MNDKNASIPRSLGVDFDKYVNGDQDFKRELISHLIDNMKELQQALPDQASDANSSTNFIKVLHKVKTTVMMLEDRELTQTLDEIKASIISNHPSEFFKRKLKLLSELCDQLIESLTAELNSGYRNITSRSVHF